MKFSDWLIKEDACESARDWARGKSVEQIWQKCPQGDWLMWLVPRIVQKDESKVEIVRIALECAQLVQHLNPDPRIADCLRVVSNWCDGQELSNDQLRGVSWAAADAARDAAADAAWAAAGARAAAWAAAGAAAWAAAETHQKCAEIVRKHLAWDLVKTWLARAGIELDEK